MSSQHTESEFLCEACQKIFQSIVPKVRASAEDSYDPQPQTHCEYGNHQSSCRDLERASEQGCYICRVLKESISDQIWKRVEHIMETETRCLFVSTAEVNPEREDLLGVRIGLNRMGLHGIPIEERDIAEFVLWPVNSESPRFILGAVTACSIENTIERTGELMFGLSHTEGELSAKPLSAGSSNSDAAWNRVRQWTENCSRNHKSCRVHALTQSAPWYPTRLLELPDSNDQVGAVKLIETKDKVLEGPYVTLSHCWGKGAMIKLTRSNLEEFKLKIPTLPKTFEDAILVSQKLGVRYLWIDSLNIIQGDTEDWQIECSLMHKVYQNSFCNIAATASADSHGGLFFDRSDWTPRTVFVPEARYPEPRVGFDVPGRKGCDVEEFHLLDGKLFSREVENQPLLKRGWVLQERLLAPRILHFGRNQIFWECNKLCACEAYPEGLPSAMERDHAQRMMKGRGMVFEEEDRKASKIVFDASLTNNQHDKTIQSTTQAESRRSRLLSQIIGPLLSRSLSTHRNKRKQEDVVLIPINRPPAYYRGQAKKKKVGEEEVRVWYSIVQAYTQASLTVTSDKLPALSGVAKFFQPIFGDTYLAGIWRDHMQMGLGWYCEDQNSLLPRPEGYRAPTWSWASTDNRVTISEHPNPMALLHILEAHVKPATNDPTGPVSTGFLVVEGILNGLIVRDGSAHIEETRIDSCHIYFDDPSHFQKSRHSISGFALLLEKYIEKKVTALNWVQEVKDVTCFRFLFLEVSTTNPGHYTRLGLGYCNMDDSKALMEIGSVKIPGRGYKLKIV